MFKSLLLLLFFTLTVGRANSAELPRSLVELNPVERTLFNDLSDGRLNNFNLIQTSLIASGVQNQATLDKYHTKYQRLSKRIRIEVANLPTKHDKARAVHAKLHKGLFKKYQIYANSVKDVFDTGRYNCVSAAIIENAILSDMGLRTQAVRSPTHVYSLVHTEKGAIEIENTTPEGFNPIRSKTRWRNMLKRQRSQMKKEDREGIAAYIRAVDSNKRTIIGNQTLVAALYSNTGVLRSRAGSKRSQLSNFIKAALLSKGDPIYVETMEALLHNQIVYLISMNRNTKALAAMEDTAILVGSKRSWQRKFKDWKISMIDKLARIDAQGSRYPQAVAHYDEGLKDWPNDPLLQQNRRVALIEWADNLIGQNKCLAGLKRYQTLFTEKSDQALIQNRYVHAIKSCSDRLQYNRKSTEAVGLVTQELTRAKQHFRGRNRQKNLRIIENLLAEAHFNAKDYQAAAGWFQKGLPKTSQNYAASVNNQVAVLINEGQNQKAMAVGSKGLSALMRFGKKDATLQNLIWTVAINESRRLYQKKRYQSALKLLQTIPNNQRPKRSKITPDLVDVESALYLKLGKLSECRRSVKSLSRRFRARWADARLQQCSRP